MIALKPGIFSNCLSAVMMGKPNVIADAAIMASGSLLVSQRACRSIPFIAHSFLGLQAIFFPLHRAAKFFGIQFFSLLQFARSIYQVLTLCFRRDVNGHSILCYSKIQFLKNSEKSLRGKANFYCYRPVLQQMKQRINPCLIANNQSLTTINYQPSTNNEQRTTKTLYP